jgi:hypothetical protein
MRAWNTLLSHLSIALLSLMLLSSGSSEAAPKLQKASPKSQPSSIVGEIEGMEDGDSALGQDEVRTTQPKSKGKAKKTKSVRALEKEKLENIKRAKEQEKEKKKEERILTGFEKAEKFHNEWFHLSPVQLKKAAENLTKFCTVACTKKQCANLDIANNCHLMCPESTRKNCSDPLKQGGCGTETAEVPIGNEDKGDDDPFLKHEAEAKKSPKDDAEKDVDREG